MNDPKPRRYWIRKGTGGWPYETKDEDYHTIVMLSDSYYNTDGSFVPAINGIEYVEASAYDALEARIVELEAALIRIRDMTPPVGQSFGPYDAENIAYVADDALNEKGKAK